MRTPQNPFSQIILDELARGDRRLLSLTVAIRRTLNRSGSAKVSLTDLISSALRKLVAAGQIVDVDGIYSLPQRGDGDA
jgi:hypothetical protein